jgi:NAD(P)-dependent dehydrogenase (short-subunit alcohol dehydrogenase family)
MDLGLKEKVALVTGAGAGIGRVIALTFAQEGANVAINDLPRGAAFERTWILSHGLGEKLEDVLGKEATARIGTLTRAESVADECCKLGVKAIAAEADVTKPEEVNKMVERVIREFGRIDILVNNAGGAHIVDFINSTKEQWDYTINLCLYGVLNCCKAVVPLMIERRYGKIVNLLSDAWKGGDRGLSVYGAAKAGISSFTRTLAFEIGRYGINVNAVSPGGTTAEWFVQTRKRQEEEMGREAFEERFKRQLRLYPLGLFYGDLGKPEDVANVVVFLCSDKTRWVTGQSISVSGGYHMH